MILPNWLLCRWVSGLPNLAVDLCKTLVVQSLSFALYEAVISHGLSSHLYLVLFYCWLFSRVAGGDSEFKWISCRILSAFCSSAAASSNSYVSLIQTQGGGEGWQLLSTVHPFRLKHLLVKVFIALHRNDKRTSCNALCQSKINQETTCFFCDWLARSFARLLLSDDKGESNLIWVQLW